MKTGYKDIF